MAETKAKNLEGVSRVKKSSVETEGGAVRYGNSQLMPRRDFLDRDLINILASAGIKKGSDAFNDLMIQLVSFCVRRDHNAWNAGFYVGRTKIQELK